MQLFLIQFIVDLSCRIFSMTHGTEEENVLHLRLKQIWPTEAERERLVNLSAAECTKFYLATNPVLTGVRLAGER